MGSMRQLASMIRHVHEVHSQGVAEENSDDVLTLAPDRAEIALAAAEAEPGADARRHPLQRN
ncbi:hypothetical protein P6144_15795 [Sphingomonas sp. HITSZ_GF]|uniref:hypothetical protein n=1 Tax=Sphingomonas sp. HITSZ_GF TaxID=3037247 RepID=UPI00240D21B8|nr:hypothetical protein [Sphingomonas sp. HITSZ_GF]MDG2535123.1 hypothetical protein [Sphingomonas sp. HITSZ_GF]